MSGAADRLRQWSLNRVSCGENQGLWDEGFVESETGSKRGRERKRERERT